MDRHDARSVDEDPGGHVRDVSARVSRDGDRATAELVSRDIEGHGRDSDCPSGIARNTAGGHADPLREVREGAGRRSRIVLRTGLRGCQRRARERLCLGEPRVAT